MEDIINRIEKFLREDALSWGMLTLYAWIIACGVFFYYRYYAQTYTPKKPKAPGKFKVLMDELQEVKSLLMESDSNVEQADEMFSKIEKDAKKLVEKYGEDHHFTKMFNNINILFDKAYARIDAKEKEQDKVKRFMREQGGGSSGPTDDDEMM